MRMYYIYSEYDGEVTEKILATGAEVTARRKELNSSTGQGIPRKNIHDAELDVPTSKEGVIELMNFMLCAPSPAQIIEKYSKK